MTSDERPSEPSLDERLAAYHEALLAGEEAPEDHSSAQLAEAQQCLKLIEGLRRRSSRHDSAWLFAPVEEEEVPLSPEQSNAFEMLLHCSRNPPQQIGRFRIERLLGEGGFGIVFLAIDPDLNRQVALKVPRPEALLSQAGRGRFLREAEAAAMLSHPHLVSVYEVGRAGSLCYIVQAYCHGTSLDRWLAEHDQAVSAPTAARLILVLAEAVQHAHSRGVLHRDIKPSNVLLQSLSPLADEAAPEPADETGATDTPIAECQLPELAQLSDFGLARMIDQNLERTRSGAVLGTPAYMAPEQAEGRLKDVGTTADIYALGAVLYELLTGRPPFGGDTLLATLQAVRENEALRPKQLNGAVPADLEAICLRCLEKEPHRRYATANELAEDLARYLKGETVTARHTRRSERVVRWCRRNPTTATLLTTCLLLLTLLGAISAMATLRLKRQHGDVLDNLQRALLAEREAREAEHLERQAHQLANDRLYQVYLATAELEQRSGRSGQRVESLQALSEALRLALDLRRGDIVWDELRRRAAISMALPDLRPVFQWPLDSDAPASAAFDADATQYAYLDRERRISIRDVATNAASGVSLKHSEFFDVAPVIHFSKDGRFLAAMTRDQADRQRLAVWERETGARLFHTLCRSTHPGRAFDFTGAGEVVYVSPAGKIHLHHLPSETNRVIWQSVTQPSHLRITPGGEQLAIARGSEVEILDLDTQAIATSLQHPHEVRAIAWSRDAQRVAVAGADRSFYIWDLASGKRLRFEGHEHAVDAIAFHPHDHLVASSSTGGTTHLWDVRTGKRLLTASGRICGFSRDGRWLSFVDQAVAGRWEFSNPCSYHLSAGHKSDAHVTGLAFSLEGQFLISSGRDGVRVWDLVSRQPVADLSHSPVTNAVIDTAGLHLITSGDSGVQRRSLIQSNGLVIGTAESLDKKRSGWAALSGDGQQLVVAGTTQPAQWMDLSGTGKRWSLPSDKPWDHVAISRDGKWLSASSWSGAEVCIFNVQTRQKELSRSIEGRCRVAFGPDGQYVAVSDESRCAVWRVGSWDPVWQISNSARSASPICFTADSNSIAWVQGSDVVLLDAGTGKERLRLTMPERRRLESLTLSPAHDKLAVGTTQGDIYVWDLERIRAGLAAMGLERETQWLPLSHPKEESASRPRVEMLDDQDPWPSNSFLTHANLASEQGRVEIYTRKIEENPADAVHYRRRADSLRRVGRTAEAQSDYRRALELLDRRIELHPDDMRALRERGLLLARLRDYSRALADLNRHLEQVPDSISSLCGQAHIYRKLGKWDEALAAYTRAIELDPEAQDPYVQDAYRFRAYIHRVQGDYSRGIADLKQGLKIRPEHSWSGYHGAMHNELAWYYLTGPEEVRDGDAAREHAMQAVALAPRSWMALSTRGSVHYEHGEYDMAVEFLQRAIDANSRGATGYEFFYLAMAHCQRGEMEKAYQRFQQGREYLDKFQPLLPVWAEELEILRTRAEELLDQAKVSSGGTVAASEQRRRASRLAGTRDESRPSNGSDFLQRGSQLHEQGETAQAQVDFRRAIELFDEEIGGGRESAEPYHQRGHAHYNLEQHDQAARDFAQALRMQPSAHLAEMQGHALRKSARWEEAIVAYSCAIESDVNAQSSHFWRGMAHMMLGELDAASEGFERSLELKPVDRWPCQHLAWIYTFGPPAVRNPDRAVDLSQQAVKLDPKAHSHRDALAAACYRTKQYEKALDVLEETQRGDEDRIEVQFLFALTYAELGQYQRAQECYQRALLLWQKQAEVDPYRLILFQWLNAEAVSLGLRHGALSHHSTLNTQHVKLNT